MSNHPCRSCLRLGSHLAAVIFIVAASLVAAAQPLPRGGIAFVGVTIVPVDGERVVSDQTVVVRDGHIHAVGATEDVELPSDLEKIGGAGFYLMPGLAEMHGHLPKASPSDKTVEDILFLYVANGVTTVRGMDGHASQIAVREQVRRGDLIGPQLFLAAPELNGDNTKTVREARRRVEEYKATGFDLIKVHEGLQPEVFNAIATAAREFDIPFAGHVSDHVGLFGVLEAGQATIDHLDNYVEALVPDEMRSAGEALVAVETIVDDVDDGRIALVVEATRRAGTGVVPTMLPWEKWLFATRPSAQLVPEWGELQYMPAETVQWWMDAVDQRVEGADLEGRRKVLELRRRLLLALHRGGVGILLGTDSPQVFSVPGFSIHREARLYVDAGLRPYDVLYAGTRAVAEHFDAADDFGGIEVGMRADLVLLRGNPLNDIGAIARPAGVMVGGRWLSEKRIETRLLEIASRYGAR